MRFAKAPEGTEARLDWRLLGRTGDRRRAQTLDLKLADGTSTLAAASGFRYGGELIGAIVARPAGALDQRLDARAGPALRPAAAAGAAAAARSSRCC